MFEFTAINTVIELVGPNVDMYHCCKPGTKNTLRCGMTISQQVELLMSGHARRKRHGYVDKNRNHAVITPCPELERLNVERSMLNVRRSEIIEFYSEIIYQTTM
jgi:hypothetical protein